MFSIIHIIQFFSLFWTNLVFLLWTLNFAICLLSFFLCLSVYVCCSISLSVSTCLSLCFYLSLSLSLFLPVSICFHLSLSVSTCLSLCLSDSLNLALSVFLFLYFTQAYFNAKLSIASFHAYFLRILTGTKQDRHVVQCIGPAVRVHATQHEQGELLQARAPPSQPPHSRQEQYIFN